MMKKLPSRRPLLAALMAGAMTGAPAFGADGAPISTRNSFRLGDAGVLCTAQSKPSDVRLKGIFDRAYLLTCRDAAGAVGSAVALRRPFELAALPSALPVGSLTCQAPSQVTLEGVGPVTALKCRDEVSSLDYLRYALVKGKDHLLVEGLAGYEPALRLALASLATDRPQSGVVQVATTEVSDPAAFARTQAGALDAAGARTEAYARSNGSRFAESAQFFESMAEREAGNSGALAEALANQGLQQSNLGNFSGALRLLNRADTAAPRGDGVTQRLIRNYRALNQLNQRDPAAALSELAKEVAPVAEDQENQQIRNGLISVPLATLINRESATGQEVTQLGATLTPSERAAVLDAQASELAGIALRQQGKLAEAAARLDSAASDLSKVRDGKLRSIAWLQGEIGVERALVAEAAGDRTKASGAFDQAIGAIGRSYPDSPALLAVQARKAGYLLRSGDAAGARSLFDSVVTQSATVNDSASALRGLLGPYFDLLAKDGSGGAAAAMFRAAQVLERPGIAQTQAILARQMSAGNDEASAMFRLALARTREIVRAESEIAELSALPSPSPAQASTLSAAKSSLDALRSDQTRIQAQLANFPRYKVLAPAMVELKDLQAALRPGEGYDKMMVVDGAVYSLYATQGAARALKLGIGADALGSKVAKLRDSIQHVENGQVVTVPFDVALSRELYLDLLGSIDDEVQGLDHFIFEPDGAMLELPPNVLVTRQDGVDRYRQRVARANADLFDFTGIDWLGRGRKVTIAVSPRSFLDVRAIAPSRAREAYLGLGSNAVATIRPAVAVADDCDWPIQTWQAPISPAELQLGEAMFGSAQSRVVTGAAFTDTALLSDKQLDDYRIVHFATHGLVTSPRPDCPARPALVTSFAPDGSDGLLSFREIFDLQLDADVVILSACDTAGQATLRASREAGLATGGNYALDGLVRAFVGAGARSVVASHWPVTDEFDATKRLIGGLLQARPGETLAGSLERAQEGLMDDRRTSHPYYWAAFIILGDGAKTLVPAQVAAAPAPGRNVR